MTANGGLNPAPATPQRPAFVTNSRRHRVPRVEGAATTADVPVSASSAPFGCVGAMDGADAAYRDVLAAVPKGADEGGTGTAMTLSGAIDRRAAR